MENKEAYVNKGAYLKSVNDFELSSNSVCLLKLQNGTGTGTGFYLHLKCGDKMLLGIMTNNHILRHETEVYGVSAIFKYNSPYDRGIEVKLDPKLFFYTEPHLDFTFTGVDYKSLESHNINPVVCLEKPASIEELLSDGLSKLTIFQHPLGGTKQYSDEAIRFVDRPFFGYFADTLDGSSGSPIFLHNPCNFQLIGIHHSGWEGEYNKGTLIEEIMEYLSTGKYTWPPKGIYQNEALLEEVKKTEPEPDLEKVRTIIELGVDPNIQDMNSGRKERPLHYAVKNKNVALVWLLLMNKADPNATDSFKLSPLHLAAENGCTDIAEFLIQENANLEAYTQNAGQDTPLHFAARQNQPEMIKLLVRHGADVNARNQSYESSEVEPSATPLLMAVEGNKLDAVRALVECSADISITNNANDTPLMIALTKGHHAIAEYLKAVKWDQDQVLRFRDYSSNCQ